MDLLDFKTLIIEYSRKINENVKEIITPISEKHGLTTLQARIIMELYKNESHTIGSLGESISVACTNMSAMCKKLEKMEYIKRIRDKGDERVVKVILTEKGNGVAEEINKLFYDKISQFFSRDPESLQDIIKGLEKLNELLEKIKA